MQAGAKNAGRDTPPLIAHAPVCVHDKPDEARAAAKEQLANYPKSPFYQQMFAASGHPEAANGEWSDGMLDDVVFIGDEEQVANRLRELLSWGATEIIAHPVLAGQDHEASLRRTLELVAAVDRTL